MGAQLAAAAIPPSARYMLVTPDLAREWLGRNPSNRRVRRFAVEAYARDMAAGRWRVTGESIAFDADGDLVDGQHRLAACANAGVPVTFLVTRGLDRGVQAVIDSGTPRNAADMLSLSGIRNPQGVAAIARLGVIRDAGRFGPTMFGNLKVTHSEIQQWVEHNPDVYAAAAAAARYARHIDIRQSVLGITWLMLTRVDKDDAQEFYESLAHNATEGPGDPRAALLTRIANARRNAQTLTTPTVAGLIIRTWNAWRRGETMDRIPVTSRSGRIHVPEPL